MNMGYMAPNLGRKQEKGIGIDKWQQHTIKWIAVEQQIYSAGLTLENSLLHSYGAFVNI